MTATTVSRKVTERANQHIAGPWVVKAAEIIPAGAIVCLDSNGEAVNGTAATGLICVGLAKDYVDNTDDGKEIETLLGDYLLDIDAGDAVSQDEFGDVVYIADNQTICKTATGKSPAGIFVGLGQSAGKGFVSFQWMNIAQATALLAANNLSDLGSAGTARANLGVERQSVTLRVTDLVAANAKVYRYVHRGPTVLVTEISSVISKALAAGNATITASIGGVAVTTGVLTITQAGSAAGDIDTCLPSAARTLADGAVLELTVGGANTDADVYADVTVELTY